MTMAERELAAAVRHELKMKSPEEALEHVVSDILVMCEEMSAEYRDNHPAPSEDSTWADVSTAQYIRYKVREVFDIIRGCND